jgi:hypothetical protein
MAAMPWRYLTATVIGGELAVLPAKSSATAVNVRVLPRAFLVFHRTL